MIGKLSIFGCVAGLAVMSGTAWAAPPPASAFGRLPGISNAAISPDGTHIALVAGSADQRTLTLSVVDSPKSITGPLGKTDVSGIQWADNQYLLLGVKALVTGLSDRNIPYNYHFVRQIVIEANGKPHGRLLSNSDASNYVSRLPIIQVSDGPKTTATVIGYDWSPDQIAQTNNTHFRHDNNYINPALWKVDIATGNGALVDRGNKNTENWFVDRQGAPRVRIDYNEETRTWTLLARSKTAGGWSTIFQTQNVRVLPDALGYCDAEDAVYLRESTSAGEKIVRRTLANGEVTVIAKTNKREHLGLAWDARQMAPMAIVTTSDIVTYRWLDPVLGKADAKLTRVLKGKTLSYEGWSADHTQILVTAEAPDSPPEWYLFDNTKNTLSPIGSSYPELAGVKLGEVSYITYKARDGMEIPAYLTLPPTATGARPAGRRPLIVLPHGGPAARDYFDFDWWSQYLATQGYVVLRPQFRGSGGFGQAFQDAGEHEWGGKMQTDLLDGITDLAAKGLIDPARVCVVGASFGGYAALAGATLNASAYKCAVSVNGVADLPLILGENAREGGADSPVLDYWRRVIGDTRENEALVTATSPYQQVDKVKAPILLIYSDQDETVPNEQTIFMDDALHKAGKSVKLVVLKGDDHYMSRSATRTQMLDEVGKFLQTNLPVTP